MKTRLIKTVTRLITLHLGNFDFQVVGKDNQWQWKCRQRSSAIFEDELGAVLSACEQVILNQPGTAQR